MKHWQNGAILRIIRNDEHRLLNYLLNISIQTTINSLDNFGVGVCHGWLMWVNPLQDSSASPWETYFTHLHKIVKSNQVYNVWGGTIYNGRDFDYGGVWDLA